MRDSERYMVGMRPLCARATWGAGVDLTERFKHGGLEGVYVTVEDNRDHIYDKYHPAVHHWRLVNKDGRKFSISSEARLDLAKLEARVIAIILNTISNSLSD